MTNIAYVLPVPDLPCFDLHCVSASLVEAGFCFLMSEPPALRTASSKAVTLPNHTKSSETRSQRQQCLRSHTEDKQLWCLGTLTYQEMHTYFSRTIKDKSLHFLR